MKYKHIIWDYNGTILDDVELCHDILNTMLSTQNKKPHDIVSYRDIFGFPIKDYYIRAGFDFRLNSFEELAEYYVLAYGEKVGECTPRNGVANILQEVQRLGIRQSILTAGKKVDVEYQLRNLYLYEYFDFITGLDDDYANSKMHLIPTHLGQIDCNTGELLFVGDTDHDAAVAKEIGCDCVLLTNGHQSVQMLESTNQIVIDDVDKILDIIDDK